MPITAIQANNLFTLATVYRFPVIHKRLQEIGLDNLAKYLTPERFSKIKNGMIYNDPSKAIKALQLMPGNDDNQPITPKQVGAIYSLSKQWFMPQSIQHLAERKDLNKLTKLQASTVIDRLKRIEADIQAADDIESAADELDLQVVTMILESLPISPFIE